MMYRFVPMNEKAAHEIAFEWKYSGIYSFYDMTADQEDLEEFLDCNQWKNKFAVRNSKNELCGFFSYYFQGDLMWIGFGLKPEWTGKGYGPDFITDGIEFGVKHFAYKKELICLAVAKFNKRAIKVYEKLGFQITDEYVQETNGGEYEFLRMSKELI